MRDICLGFHLSENTPAGGIPPQPDARRIAAQTFTRSDLGSYIGLRLASARTRVPATSIS
jgi:hypothetical protein